MMHHCFSHVFVCVCVDMCSSNCIRQWQHGKYIKCIPSCWCRGIVKSSAFNGRVIATDKSNTQINAISKAQKPEMHPQVNHIFPSTSSSISSHYLSLFYIIHVVGTLRCNTRYTHFSNEFLVGVVLFSSHRFGLVWFGIWVFFTSICMIFPPHSIVIYLSRFVNEIVANANDTDILAVVFIDWLNTYSRKPLQMNDDDVHVLTLLEHI